MNRLRVMIVLICFSGIPSIGFSQTNKNTFTFQEALDYALKNHVKSANAVLDIEKSKHIVNENIGQGLLQVNGNAQYNYNIDPPVFVFPNVFGPVPDPNSFTTIKAAPLNSMNMSATASLLVFSGQYFVGIQTANAFLEMTKQQKVKSDIEVKEQVAKAYYMVLIAQESEKLIDSTFQIVSRTLFETQQLNKEGLVEELDAEQIQLVYYNVSDARNQVKQAKELALMALKFQMGYPVSQQISLSDDLKQLLSNSGFEGLTSTLTDSIDVRTSIDYQLIAQKLKIDKFQVKLQKMAALPTLSTFFNVGGNFFNNQRWLFLGDGTVSNLNGVIWGFNLQVPIFSSWSRVSKLKQLKIEVQKTQRTQQNVEQALQLSYKSSKTSVIDNYKRFLTASKSFELAEKIRKVNGIKYREGLVSSLALSQAEQQYFDNQQKYFQAVFELLNSKIQLDKSMNKF
jgi:outer membrane protein